MHRSISLFYRQMALQYLSRKLSIAHLLEFRSGDRFSGGQVELAGDGFGGDPVVSGNHDYLNAGLLAEPDSFFSFFTRRVCHTSKTDKDQIISDELIFQFLRLLWKFNISHG